MYFSGAVLRRASVALTVSVAALTVVLSGCGSDGSNASTTTVPTTVASHASVSTTTEAVPTSTSVPVATSTTVAVQPPATPTGPFINSNTLSLGAGGGPTSGASVCTTSPGATCEIRFTKDGETRSLPAKQVDADGHASWDWTPAEIGLTSGSWTLEVVATRDGRTATASDPLGLQVVP